MSYWTAELSESIEELARIEQEEVAYLDAPEVLPDPWADDEDEAAIAAAEAEYDAHVNA
jgi:hypothetical protein